jgi:CRP-like cAMP-binding protein
MDTSRIVAFPDFANLPAQEIDELAGAMTEIDVEAGDTVVHVDDYGRAIYLIEVGNAEVLNEGGDPMQALGPGETFGEIGLLLTGQRTATVVARTPMRLLSLSGQGFDGIQPRVPELERCLRRLGLRQAGS